MTRISTHAIVDALDPVGLTEKTDPVCLSIGGLVLELRCTSSPLLAELLRYFQHVIVAPTKPDKTIHVLADQVLPYEIAFSEWKREPGKTNRKDAIHDLENARLIQKVRTGIQFFQSPDWSIVFGPTDANPNQVINFVNTQILCHFQRQNWVACHAAALKTSTKGLAIAGLSGGGKSTTMLRLMEISGTQYVTNDRLLVQDTSDAANALGIPKLPRINPGTIITNSRLSGILDDEREEELKNMEPDELWHLEEKYDLFIDDIYGPGRISHETGLTDFWVLNWSRDSFAPTEVKQTELFERPDLLAAIVKNPGPFFQKANGEFWTDTSPLDTKAYLKALKNVQLWEVSGQIDFDALFEAGSQLLGQTP